MTQVMSLICIVQEGCTIEKGKKWSYTKLPSPCLVFFTKRYMTLERGWSLCTLPFNFLSKDFAFNPVDSRHNVHINALPTLHFKFLRSLIFLQLLAVKEELQLFPADPTFLNVLVHHLLHLLSWEDGDEHRLTPPVFRLEPQLNPTLWSFTLYGNPNSSL